MSDNADSPYAWTDMGWGPTVGPWRYRALSEGEIFAQLARDAYAEFDATAKVASVTFQPCLNEDERSQDRRVVQSWDLRDGRWTFTGIFDGHAGHETADHAVVEVPSRLKSALESALSERDSTSPSRSPDQILSVLAKVVSDYDKSLLADLSGLFPGGLEGVSKLSEQEIDEIINDTDRGGENLKKVHRCMRGSTALISLVDPLGENLWVANLGDCEAVLGTKLPDGKWEATLLTANHNGDNEAEVQRVRDEHPGEDECILNQRVLGAIAVTRALGDFVFKLPSRFATDVFLLARPGFLFKSSSLPDWIARNITPPYLSHHPDVHHRKLAKGDESSPAGRDAFLVMYSDGLTDLFRGEGDAIDVSAMARWVSVVGSAVERGEEENAALALLRYALGGEDLDKVSRHMMLENIERWMDDTTITVQTL